MDGSNRLNDVRRSNGVNSRDTGWPGSKYERRYFVMENLLADVYDIRKYKNREQG